MPSYRDLYWPIRGIGSLVDKKNRLNLNYQNFNNEKIKTTLVQMLLVPN